MLEIEICVGIERSTSHKLLTWKTIVCKVAGPKGPFSCIVECRVSIVGIIIMIWESFPHNSTYDPLGGAAVILGARSFA